MKVAKVERFKRTSRVWFDDGTIAIIYDLGGKDWVSVITADKKDITATRKGHAYLAEAYRALAVV
ncbi:hypothetical protein [Thermococcus sp.]|uniref:hypothetical protein n=1 Tax=Thermococcus sp. TaxID=35749 RepID=UPI0026363A0D|nr:hypothetical protein [Thermococcus sp.]